MVTVQLNLPDDVYLALQSAGLNREQLETQAIRDFAVQLYNEGRLSFGKASRMANLPLSKFWQLLVERGIPVFTYTEEDYKDDLDAVEQYSR